MKTKLRRALHELLLKDDISLESNIVNEIVYRMIGIELEKKSEGFDLSDYSRYYSSQVKDETIYFSVPNGLDRDDLDKILLFFKNKTYKTGTRLTLDNDVVMNDILPNFEKYYQNLKVENPTLIAQYRVKSRPILESSATDTIKEHSGKVVNAICSKPELSHLKFVKKTLNALSKEFGLLETYPTEYKDIIEIEGEIKSFLDLPEIKDNKDLASSVRLILEGIALFTRYHRYESVIANGKFMSEMEKFLNEHKVSGKLCNVIEDTLLGLVGASLGPKGNAEISTGSDKSRLVLRFTDISKENAEKVVKYCLEQGDETASLGYGSRQYGSSIPESTKECAMLSISSVKSLRIYEPEKQVESHSIELDGEFFYKTIFPQLQKTILEMVANNSEKIAFYRKHSESMFPAETLKVSDNKSTLFQLPNGPFDDDTVRFVLQNG